VRNLNPPQRLCRYQSTAGGDGADRLAGMTAPHVEASPADAVHRSRDGVPGGTRAGTAFPEGLERQVAEALGRL